MGLYLLCATPSTSFCVLGHLIHIDFGFILGIAPGGAFSIETAPFKITPEMIQVMGGVDSKLFAEFALLFSAGFLALQVQVCVHFYDVSVEKA